MLSAAHAAPELMELAEAEALGILHDDEGGVGDIHAHLDDRGGDEDVDLPRRHGGHDRLLVLRLQLPVHAGHAQIGEAAPEGLGMFLGALELRWQLVVFLHHRADDEDLPPLGNQPADKAVEALAVALVHGEGVHLLPPRRQLVHDGDVEIAVDDEGQGARDGGRRHDQDMGPLPLADQGRTLADAEAVLLVRDDKAQVFVFHIRAEQGVGADHEIQLPVFELLAHKALLLRRHGAGEPPDPEAQRAQQLRQRRAVLLGQDLRRGHEGRHIPVFRRVPDQRRRDQRLAAAHVALHQSVHHASGVHVAHGLLHGAPLRPGGCKGQRRPEAREVGRRHADAGLLCPLPAHFAEGAGQDEKLLKNEPPARKLQGLEVLREVDILKGVARLGKAVALPHGMGQDVRKLCEAGVQGPALRLEHVALGKARREPVHRQDAPGELPLPLRPLGHGVHHAAAGTVRLHLAVEDIALPAQEIVLRVGHVEVGDVECPAVVHGAQLHELQAPAHPGQARGVGHHGLNAHALPVLREGDGLAFAAVLIAPGEKRNKVTQRKDAEPVERLRLFLSYALDETHVGIQLRHRSLLHVAKRVCGIGGGKLLDEALGADDLVVGVDEHHVKAPVLRAVLPPVAEGLALPQDEHGGGEAVGGGAVGADDGHGFEGIVHGSAGLGVDEVVVGLAVLDKEALIGAGGDHGSLAEGEDADIACGVVRVLHGHVPERAVRLSPEGLDVAAQGDDAACDADVAHGADRVFGGAALRHGAEADGGAGGEGHGVGPGAREAREGHLIEGPAREIEPQLLIRRHVIAPAVKAPALDHGVDGEVQGAAALFVDVVGGGEHGRHLARDGDVAPLGVVDGVGGAGLDIGVEHIVHGLDDALGGGEPALGISAVGREGHDGVHGKDLPLGHFGLPAGRQGQEHHKAKAHGKQAFHR